MILNYGDNLNLCDVKEDVTIIPYLSFCLLEYGFALIEVLFLLTFKEKNLMITQDEKISSSSKKVRRKLTWLEKESAKAVAVLKEEKY
jgi:hypothetical protein